MFYRDILGQAWKNTWRNKYLWFFGLFAALLGNGGEIGLIFRGLNADTGSGFLFRFKEFVSTGIFSKGIFANIAYLATEAPFSFFMLTAVLFVFLLLVLFMLWLIMVSQGALIHNAVRITTGKKHDFKDGLEMGIKKFWPVFSLNVLLKIVIFAVLAIISMPILTVLSKGSFSVSSFFFVVLYLIFIPFIVVISFIVRYIIAFVVIKGEKFWQAVNSGWSLFLKNWLVSLELAFILFAINLLVALILIVGVMILAVPFFFVMLVFTKISLYINIWFVILIGMILFLCIIVLTGAILATFQINAWIKLFIELVGKGGVSKIVRIFDKTK